ncbi:hypothetical protein HanIR_Chr16g0837671 [Helianthus annuus]|nr:hypothetical protein HanIR_Chr16g0837671 [Helianthus annuus]
MIISKGTIKEIDLITGSYKKDLTPPSTTTRHCVLLFMHSPRAIFPLNSVQPPSQTAA